MQLTNLKTHLLGKHYEFYKEIDSTQNEIWRRINENNIKNGTVISKTLLSTDTYSPKNKIVRVGTKKVTNNKTTTTQNGKEVIKYLTATQISMANNQIKDISVLGELTNIEYLNLSGNNIQIITPIEKFNFTKGVNLRNQTIDMPIYAKKNQENHYVILFNIMQSAKNSESIAYDSNASFTTEGLEDLKDVTPQFM